MSIESLPESISQVNCIYFLKNSSGQIPIPLNAADANETMSLFLEIGYLSGQALLMLEQVLSEVYLPLLSNMTFENTSLLGDAKKKDSSSSSSQGTNNSIVSSTKDAALKADLVVSIQKFATQVSHFSQQVSGGNGLKIPDDILALKDANVDDSARNSSLTKRLESLAEEWIEAVSSCLAREGRKVPVGNVRRFSIMR